MSRSPDPLQNLADALAEDIVAASPAALAAEAAQERGAGDAFALDFDRIVDRAERQARWRRLAWRLRALAAALTSVVASVVTWRPSRRPVLATLASLAVIVVVGDLFLHQRERAPMMASAPTPVDLSRKPLADKLAQQPSLQAESGAEASRYASGPVAPAPPPTPALAPPPAPAANAVDAPKPVQTVPMRLGNAAHDQPPARARAAQRPLPPSDRDAALSLVEEHSSRAATAQRKMASQPSAPQVAAVPAEPAPASAAASGGLDSPSFIWPLRGGLIAGFGAEANGRHNDGIDIAVPVGSDIRAAADGVVVYASDDIKGYGNLVLLRHSGGFVTAYAHADKILVKLNDVVHRGQVIAKSGSKPGRTGGVPSLHFEIREGATPVDPMQFLPRG